MIRLLSLPTEHLTRTSFLQWECSSPPHFSNTSFDYVFKHILPLIDYTPPTCLTFDGQRMLESFNQFLDKEWTDDPHYCRPRMIFKHISSSSRQFEIILGRLRTRHVFLNDYAHRHCGRDSPNCNTCTAPETVTHFLIDCPLYYAIRQPLLLTLSRVFSIPTDSVTSAHLLGDIICSQPDFRRVKAALNSYIQERAGSGTFCGGNRPA